MELKKFLIGVVLGAAASTCAGAAMAGSERSKADLHEAVTGLATQLMWAHSEAERHEMLMDLSCAKVSRAATRAALPRVEGIKQAARADEAAYLATGRTPHLSEFELSFVAISEAAAIARLHDLAVADLPDKYQTAWPHYRE